MISGQIFFQESQQFRQPLLWVGYSAITLLSVGGVASGLLRKSFLRHSLSLRSFWPLLFIVGVFGLVGALLGAIRMDTEVRNDGLYVRFYPLLGSAQRVGWEQVKDAQVVTVHPIADYGGWGIRSGMRGKAYLVSGNGCILLSLTSGQSLCVGSQRPQDLSMAIALARGVH